MSSTFQQEIAAGQRFRFGRNWRAFLSVLDQGRISVAEQSVREALGVDSLAGKTVIDVGCGSGLFSLVSRRLGAKVRSFDFDPDSVACARELRDKFFPNDPDWAVEEGSILDADYVRSLGTFDIVYSWGVLHHTGRMWEAIANASGMVAPRGQLFIAIYNDRGHRSRLWVGIKRLYCSSLAGKVLTASFFLPYMAIRTLAQSIAWRTNAFTAYRRNRGMSAIHDWFDWLGGYPYEFAAVDAIFQFCSERGFTLRWLRTTRGLGNNEYVFQRSP